MIVQELRQKYKVIDLIKVARVARSTYYYQVKQINKPDKYEKVKSEITNIYHEHKGRYGYRRIMLELANRGIRLNHKTVQRLMNQLGLKSLIRDKKYKSYRGYIGKISPNVLSRDFKTDKPNCKWVTDITQFSLLSRRFYLSPILDLFNGEIISYAISDKPTYGIVRDMLEKALKKLPANHSLVLHSDQGMHYQMKVYSNRLLKYGITQSMSRKGNCLDNAVIENFFGILKSEWFNLTKFKNIEQFIDGLHEYIYYYNNDRIKAKLNGMSPIVYRTHSINST